MQTFLNTCGREGIDRPWCESPTMGSSLHMTARVIIGGYTMINFNATELKNFRNTLALYHIADFNKADADISKSTFIRSREVIINSNLESIAKIDESKGKIKTIGGKSKAEIEKQNVELRNEINAKKEEISVLKEEYDKDTKEGLALITEDLRTALKNYVNDIYNTAAENALYDAVVEWFKAQGAKSASKIDVEKFVKPLGVVRGSARTKCATNKHTRAVNGKNLDQLFLDIICDEPTVQKLLPIHKWENKIEKKARQKKSAE